VRNTQDAAPRLDQGGRCSNSRARKTAKAFEESALEKAYPKVYRNDPILPLFASAKATEGITPEQTTALEELEVKYVAEIPDVNAPPP
jgi:hypothetical protein